MMISAVVAAVEVVATLVVEVPVLLVEEIATVTAELLPV